MKISILAEIMDDITYTWLLPVTAKDQREILEVFLDAFVPQGRMTKEELTEYFDEKMISRLEEGHSTFVARDKEKIIGFAIFEKLRDGEYYLAEMALSPFYHKKGIGKKLLFAILHHDKKAGKILLVVHKNNVACAFYEKSGFKLSSFRYPGYPDYFIGYEYSIR